MQISDYIKKRNLDQLTDAWKYLTPAQRKILRLRVQIIVTKQNIKNKMRRLYYAPLRILSLLHYRVTYPAHWL